MIQFEMLGQIALRDGAGHSIDRLLRQPKRLALLGYLASPIPGRWHRRDTVLALFWPELDTAHARTALRNAVYVLRQALGEAVIRNRGDDELSVDPGLLETDLGRLRVAIASSDHAAALATYRGELLPALYAPDCDGFDRWLDGERAQLRTEVAALGLRGAALMESEGVLGAARALTRQVLALQPDDETVVRRLMLLHEAEGDPAGGLAVYETHRQRLEREYDARPAAETTSLAERLRRGPPAGSTAAVPAPPLGVQTPHAAMPNDPRAGRRRRGAAWLGVGLVAMVALMVLALRRQPLSLAPGVSRPVTNGDGLQIEPALSPNGRLIAFAQGTALRMRLQVIRLDGGLAWPVSRDSAAVEMMPRWAPDNDALVYLSGDNAYIAPAVGGTPRLVAAGGSDERAVRSASWSPAGDSLLIVRGDSLLVIPLEGRGARLIGTGTQLHSCAWQPTNHWIACVSGNWISFVPGPLFGNRAPSALVLFPVAGGRSTPITDHDHEYLSPTWSADGEELWLLSNRDGTTGEVYSLRIGGDGRASEEYRRIGLQAEAISLARGGLAYSVPTRRANIWTLPIEDGPTRAIRDATRFTSGNQIIEVTHATAGQQWLVYDSDLRGNSDIYRVPLRGGQAERLTDDSRPEFTGTLSPDGREIAYHQWHGAERRLRVRNLGSGVVTEPVPEPGDQGVPRWSPDGQSLAYWKHGREPGAIAVVHRGADGRWGAPAWGLDGAQLPIWSADGSQIAYVTTRGDIHLISSDSSAQVTLYAPTTPDDPVATYLAWDAARDRIWFIGHRPSGASGVWWIPAKGKAAPRKAISLEDAEGRVNGPSLTLDGTRLFFTLDERLSNIRWAELRHR